MNQLVDLYFTYQFLKRLVLPFHRWEAHTLGIIDAQGNILRPRAAFTTRQESEAWGRIDVLAANLKRLLAMVPGGRTVMASMTAALLLLKEDIQKAQGGDNMPIRAKDLFEKTRQAALEEDAPVNNVAGGAIAGATPGEDPPIHNRPDDEDEDELPMLRRSPPITEGRITGKKAPYRSPSKPTPPRTPVSARKHTLVSLLAATWRGPVRSSYYKMSIPKLEKEITKARHFWQKEDKKRHAISPPKKPAAKPKQNKKPAQSPVTINVQGAKAKR